MSETQTIDFDGYVDRFVRLRNKIRDIEKRHKDELAPYKDAREKLEAILLQHLTNTNQNSAATDHGTVYKSHKDSCSVADMTAFWDFVQQTSNLDMVDRKANVTAVRDYMEETGKPVPGVNFSSRITVGVIAKNGK